MKRFLFGKKDNQALIYTNSKEPKGSPWNVVIKIHASSVNPHDWQYYGAMRHLYKLPIPLPSISLGHDISGTIVKVGSRVKGYKVGDEVYTMSARTGAFGEMQSVNYLMVAHKPKSLSHLQAATVPLVGLTVWQMYILSKLKKGDTLLLNGASGGVGVTALQIAKARGAHVTAVCSTRNIDLVKELGADDVIDYTKNNINVQNQPFDVVFDTIGVLNPLKCSHLVKENGCFATTILGGSTFAAVLLSRLPFRKKLGLGNLRKTVTLLAMPWGKHLDKITGLIERGEFKTIIDRTYPMEELQDALDYSLTGRARGKIALEVIQDEKPVPQPN